MSPTTGILSTLEYPGRLISLGTAPDGTSAVLIYAITGRSPSSQARRLVSRDGGIWVQPTDQDGSPGLRGVRAGTTLCSLTNALSVRRTYRVVVVEAGGSPSQPGGVR